MTMMVVAMVMVTMMMAVVVMAVMAVVAVVTAMVAAVVPAVAVAAVATMSAVPVPTSERRAIDRQRGSAQCENCNRRNNDFPDLGHGHLPIRAARQSPALIENLDALNAMRCDEGHSGPCKRSSTATGTHLPKACRPERSTRPNQDNPAAAWNDDTA
ncbi:hypothetical protein LJR220_001942 [Bradyrhizobium sp. LjRoot220]|uniref:hypothetical protein n=1 Tax=Bradyrhizobium sp. LjRoot220 TaxID=3342284 RepID=UPI003ECC2757